MSLDWGSCPTLSKMLLCRKAAPGLVWVDQAPRKGQCMAGVGLTGFLLLPGGRCHEADAREEECWKGHPGS